MSQWHYIFGLSAMKGLCEVKSHNQFDEKDHKHASKLDNMKALILQFNFQDY